MNNIQCIKCKIEKSLEEFSKNGSKKIGINKICKHCHSSYRKNYYQNNKEKEYSRKAGRVIKEICPACKTDVYLTKKEFEKGFIRYCSRTCRSSLNKSSYYHYLKDIEKRSEKINKDFDLNESFIKELLENKQKNKCCITNIPISIRDRKIEITLDTASLDRIDCKKGYTKDNVQWVAVGINYMKLDFEEIELHRVLKLIQDNYKPV
jgi:hypothetical protein